MGRLDDLLEAAAVALDDGRNPLDEHFLVEHEVTLDECYDLAGMLALGARMVIRNRAELRGAVGGMAQTVAAHRLVDALVDPTAEADKAQRERVFAMGPKTE